MLYNKTRFAREILRKVKAAAGRENEMLVTGVGGNKSILEFLMEGDPIMAATPRSWAAARF